MAGVAAKRDRFMFKLAGKVHEAFESAFNCVGSERDRLLQDLFTQVSSEVEDNVIERLDLLDGSLAFHTDTHHMVYSGTLRRRNSVTQNSRRLSKDMAPKEIPPDNPQAVRSAPLCYYHLLSYHYQTHPSAVDPLHTFFVSLWSNQHFPILFASLFYLWVFHHYSHQLKYLNMFLKGTNRLFWMDLESMQRRFSTIYNFLRVDILAGEKIWKDTVSLNEARATPFPEVLSEPFTDDTPSLSSASSSASELPTDQPAPLYVRTGNVVSNMSLGRYVVDFFHMVSRFLFYYEDRTQIRQNLVPFIRFIQRRFDKFNVRKGIHGGKTNPDESGDTTKTIVEPAPSDGVDMIDGDTTEDVNTEDRLVADDVFVRGVIRQIKFIKNETVLVRYLHCCGYTATLQVSDATRTKLQLTFFMYTAPGGPAYAPRTVRQAARSVLDTMYPRGKIGRDFVSALFRLLHPYYTIKSISHWVYMKAKWCINFFDRKIEEDANLDDLRI